MELKIDMNYIPCPASAGDEFYKNGVFEYNITQMTKHIKSNPKIFVPEEVAIIDIRKFLSINESHIDFVDISKPVILAEIAPSRFNLIDGQHRVEKAHRMGIEKIMAFRLSVHQHIKFLTSMEAYILYVEYWNSKFEIGNDY